MPLIANGNPVPLDQGTVEEKLVLYFLQLLLLTVYF